jgi:hypothetical protein
MARVKRTPKPLVDMPEKVSDLITFGHKVAAAGLNNTGLFQNPTPRPQDIEAAAEALDTAETATGPKAKGSVSARAPKEIALRNLLEAWATYLVGIAATMPGQEAYVYETGGLGPRRTPNRSNALLRLTQRKNAPSGQVHAACKAAKPGVKVFYGWRISLDGGKSWTMSLTNVHVTDFSNIPPGTEIQVQYNMTIKNVASAWSGSMPLIVR